MPSNITSETCGGAGMMMSRKQSPEGEGRMGKERETVVYLTDGCPPPDAKYIWVVPESAIPEIGRKVDSVVRGEGGEPLVSFMLDGGQPTPSEIEREVLDKGRSVIDAAERMLGGAPS